MSEGKYKVLQIQQDYIVRASDAADIPEQILKALPSDRFQTVAAYMHGKPAPGAQTSRADQSVYFNFSKRQLRGLRLMASWKLYRLCRREKFDAVICHRFKAVNLMLFLNRWLKIPLCVGIFHCIGDYDRKSRQRRGHKLTDQHWRFVGVSPAVKDYLVSKNAGFTPANTVSITNTIDVSNLQLMTREQARQKLGLPAEGRIIGTIGRLVPVKAHDCLIQAFSRVSEQHPDAHLAIIGGGPEQARLEALIASLRLQGRVFLTGAREEAMLYVRAFDIWTMPSLSEGLGVALIEGMYGKLPVIASDIPAMRPLTDGAGGISVPPDDAEALAAALDKYLSLTDAELKEKGQNAYDYFMRNHDIEVFRESYRRLIEDNIRRD